MIGEQILQKNGSGVNFADKTPATPKVIGYSGVSPKICTLHFVFSRTELANNLDAKDSIVLFVRLLVFDLHQTFSLMTLSFSLLPIFSG